MIPRTKKVKVPKSEVQRVVRKHEKIDLWGVRVLKFDPKAEPERLQAYMKRHPEAILVARTPKLRQIERWARDSRAKTPCGCRTDFDGTCKHGVPSWPIILGYV